jgi:hypothetical protein
MWFREKQTIKGSVIMSFKVVIPRPDRLRRVPSGFGWVDHRLVRRGHTSRLSAEAQALYLFLVTVANESGLSWYSDGRLCQQGNLSGRQLDSARGELVARSLVAHARPVYQVLELPDPHGDGVSSSPDVSAAEAEPAVTSRRLGRTLTIQEILRQMTEGGGQ